MTEIKASDAAARLRLAARGSSVMSATPPINLAERAAARRLSKLFDEHSRLASLCNELEKIADDLPRACPARSRRAAAELANLVPEHFAFERELFSALLKARQPDLLDRILEQHYEDEGLAGEIAEALESLGDGAEAPDPETLGYMLRCFFNNCRRSMLVEELAMRAVTEGDIAP